MSRIDELVSQLERFLAAIKEVFQSFNRREDLSLQDIEELDGKTRRLEERRTP